MSRGCVSVSIYRPTSSDEIDAAPAARAFANFRLPTLYPLSAERERQRVRGSGRKRNKGSGHRGSAAPRRGAFSALGLPVMPPMDVLRALLVAAALTVRPRRPHRTLRSFWRRCPYAMPRLRSVSPSTSQTAQGMTISQRLRPMGSLYSSPPSAADANPTRPTAPPPAATFTGTRSRPSDSVR